EQSLSQVRERSPASLDQKSDTQRSVREFRRRQLADRVPNHALGELRNGARLRSSAAGLQPCPRPAPPRIPGGYRVRQPSDNRKAPIAPVARGLAEQGGGRFEERQLAARWKR